MSAAPIPKELEDKIIALYAKGWTRGEIAKEVFVSPTTVSAVHKRRGLKMRNKGGNKSPPLQQFELDRTVAVYEQSRSKRYKGQRSLTEAAKQLGISPSAVAWRLKRAGFVD